MLVEKKVGLSQIQEHNVCLEATKIHKNYCDGIVWSVFLPEKNIQHLIQLESHCLLVKSKSHCTLYPKENEIIYIFHLIFM